MTLPEPTPYVSAWQRLVANERPTAKPGDPDFNGILRPRAKAVFVGICVIAVAAIWIGNSNHTTTAAPQTSYAAQGYTTADQTYLTALDRAGIQYSTPAAAIEVGHLAAISYNQGWSENQVITQMRQSAVNAGGYYTRGEVATMVTAAINAYTTRR